MQYESMNKPSSSSRREDVISFNLISIKFQPLWQDGKSSYQVKQILGRFCHLIALI